MRPSLSSFYNVYNSINCHLIVIAVFWMRSETKPLPVRAPQIVWIPNTGLQIPDSSN